MNARILILEDQYGKKIAHELLMANPHLLLPVRDNIRSPLEYIDMVQDTDIILLDNYFPGKGWEEPLGDVFLQKLLATQAEYKIICISDRGRRLIEWYDGWRLADERGWIISWNGSKDGGDIYQEFQKIACMEPSS